MWIEGVRIALWNVVQGRVGGIGQPLFDVEMVNEVAVSFLVSAGLPQVGRRRYRTSSRSSRAVCGQW
jgi:hypothetical protein